MLDRDLMQKLDMKSPTVWLATWGGCGLIKGAPGTWGTLGGLPFGIALLVYGNWMLLLGAALILFWLGYHAARKFEDMTKSHDPGAIVVDEVVGIWITLLTVPFTGPGILVAFLLFRIFDVWKPWPVNVLDKLPGALGVMADDVMAGVYAALALWGAQYAGLV